MNDPALEFYTAISFLLTGAIGFFVLIFIVVIYLLLFSQSFLLDRIQEALRQLESINDHPEVSLGAIQASIYAHKACKTVGKNNKMRQLIFSVAILTFRQGSSTSLGGKLAGRIQKCRGSGKPNSKNEMLQLKQTM